MTPFCRLILEQTSLWVMRVFDNYSRFKAHLNTYCYLPSLFRWADKTLPGDTDSNYTAYVCLKNVQWDKHKAIISCVCLCVQYECVYPTLAKGSWGSGSGLDIFKCDLLRILPFSPSACVNVFHVQRQSVASAFHQPGELMLFGNG